MSKYINQYSKLTKMLKKISERWTEDMFVLRKINLYDFLFAASLKKLWYE